MMSDFCNHVSLVYPPPPPSLLSPAIASPAANGLTAAAARRYSYICMRYY